MNLLFIHCSSSHTLLHSSTVSCFYRDSKTSNPIIRTITTVAAVAVSAKIPARDRVIDFGKHKGKMLGTLPSNYLNWVSKNLRARDFEEWAKLADEVLRDPVYRDRIEWEFAEKVLNGNVPNSLLSRFDQTQSAVSELLEMSERFGWNNDDKVGWSKIDFGLLGTSKGGRIPRVSLSDNGGVERELKLKREKSRVCNGEEARGGERRRERRDRTRLKKSTTGVELQPTVRMKRLGSEGKDRDGFEEEKDDNNEIRIETKQDRTAKSPSPFPGREALLKKVLNRKRL